MAQKSAWSSKFLENKVATTSFLLSLPSSVHFIAIVVVIVAGCYQWFCVTFDQIKSVKPIKSNKKHNNINNKTQTHTYLYSLEIKCGKWKTQKNRQEKEVKIKTYWKSFKKKKTIKNTHV